MGYSVLCDEVQEMYLQTSGQCRFDRMDGAGDG